MRASKAYGTAATWPIAVLAFLAADPSVGRAAPVVQDLGAGHYEVSFAYQAPPGTRSVHLAGSFNGWDPTALPMKGPDQDGRFNVTLPLEAGRYEYKFVLDGGNWQADPDNPLRAGEHGNSLLFVGVNPDETGLELHRSTGPVDMPSLADTPAELTELAGTLREADAEAAEGIARQWLKRHPMPLMKRETVSMVVVAPGRPHPRLHLRGPGYWMTYDPPPLVEGRPVYALTLRRAELPADASYLYELKRKEGSETLVDPCAWTVSSRGGRAVALITPTDPNRGRIRLIPEATPSAGNLAVRPIYVYTPPGYDRNPERRYPVLYMHDGQNCWDDPHEPFGHGGWHANVAADRLIAAGLTEPFIIVGVPNTAQRRDEYGPGKNITTAADHAYIRFLVQDLKPLIDRTCRTRTGPADTALMGSSMGGLISFQAALLHPEVFGKIGCLSPAFWFKDERDGTYFDLLEAVGKVPVRIYIDSGSAGPRQDGAADTRRMGEALLAAGWTEPDELRRFEADGALHNERAWRARLDKPLVFLFGTGNSGRTPTTGPGG